MNDSQETQEGPQEPLGRVAAQEHATLPTCASTGCRRRPEWTITGRDAGGAACVVLTACQDTMHRGKAAAAAWQHYSTSKVEVRMIAERH